MITDQKQTDVPSRNRVQLVKPTQTYNTGRVAPLISNKMMQTPSQTSYSPKPVLEPLERTIPPEVQAATDRGEIYNPIQPKGYVDPVVEAATAAASPTPSNVERVRQLIGEMSDDEILQILTSLSDGTLKGRGSRAQAAAPAEPGTSPTLAEIYGENPAMSSQDYYGLIDGSRMRENERRLYNGELGSASTTKGIPVGSWQPNDNVWPRTKYSK